MSFYILCILGGLFSRFVGFFRGIVWDFFLFF